MNDRVLLTLTIFDIYICFPLTTALVQTFNQYKCPFCAHAQHTHTHTYMHLKLENSV